MEISSMIRKKLFGYFPEKIINDESELEKILKKKLNEIKRKS